MYNYYNSSIIYVSPTCGDDDRFNGLAPTDEGCGNGPFKTLKRALVSIGQRRITGFMRPMTIAITEDIYLQAPVTLCIDKALQYQYTSGNGITIESYGSRKRIVGGVKITGWKKDSFNGCACISAELPKKANGSQWNFTDLFINGKRADNTRYPAKGTLKALDTEKNFTKDVVLFTPSKWFVVNKKDLEGVEGIEYATVNFYHYWIDEHTAVESYDRETGKLTMKYPSRFSITTIYEPEEHTSALNYYLENIPTMFSKPNEWYLDRRAGKVYYVPEDESIDLDSVEAYAPTVKKLFELYGNDGECISDIRLSNLELMCTRSDYVSGYVKNPETRTYEYIENSDEGFAADMQSVCYAHGAVSFKNAERCTVENCLIRHIGTHGIEVQTGCHNIRIENNEFDDIGAGGVRIFGGKSGCEQHELTGSCIIRGNRIANCGKRLAAGCGVLVCHAANNEISENEICYLDYSGISVGWVWGYADSTTYGNVIRKNHIHHIGMGKLSDMGGIYLLGKQPGTVVSYNRIHDVNSAHYGGWGIYTDEGSSYITVENNVVYNTKCESYHQHYGSYNIVRNNIFAFGSACIRVSQKELHDGIAFENNILITERNPVYGGYNNLNEMISKKNYIYDISGEEPVVYRDTKGNSIFLAQWQSCYGKGQGTVIINPEIPGIKEFDFTVSESSAVAKLGFRPINGFTASGKK